MAQETDLLSPTCWLILFLEAVGLSLYPSRLCRVGVTLFLSYLVCRWTQDTQLSPCESCMLLGP